METKTRAAFDFETWGWEPEEGEREVKVHALCCALAIPEEDEETGRTELQPYYLENTPRTEEGARALVEKVLAYMWRRPDVDEWWAHFAHAFDTLHLVAAAYRMNWRVRGAMAGYGPVGVDISPPGNSRWLAIRDLYRVVPATLEKIAKDFDLPSRKLFGKADYKGDMRELPKERLKAGCITDAVLVMETLAVVERLFVDHGGELRSTFPSSALTVVKASLKAQGVTLPKMRHGRNCPKRNCRCYWSANVAARAAYYGARVEVFHHAPDWLLKEYDVSSSYPWSMSQVLPTRWAGTVTGPLAEKAFDTGVHGIYRATVSVPQSEFPPLPYKPKDNAGLYFPSGTWTASFAYPELAYAQKLGCTVRIEEAITYESGAVFKSYVEDLYAIKRTATGARREFVKYLLNGSYGKYAEKPERERLFFMPDTLEALHYQWSEPGVRALNPDIDPRILVQQELRYAPHTHYAIGAYVTAYSRVRLHEFMLGARGLAYTDTDSLHCHGWDGETGNNLGQLKLELEGFLGRYYAAKLYSLHATDGDYLRRWDGPQSPEWYQEKGRALVACKGFLKGTGDDFESILESAQVFEALVSAGASIDVAKDAARGVGQTLTRTRLLRSQLKPGGDHDSVKRIRQSKSWSGLSKKRKPFLDGTTEAWTVKEIERGKHLKAKCPIL